MHAMYSTCSFTAQNFQWGSGLLVIMRRILASTTAENFFLEQKRFGFVDKSIK